MDQSAKTYFQHLIETSHRPSMKGWSDKMIQRFHDMLKTHIDELACD
jgi:hypothetical protein